MQNQELCILLDSILALLETDNVEKAKEVIRNAITRIDKGTTSSTRDQCPVSERQSRIILPFYSVHYSCTSQKNVIELR